MYLFVGVALEYARSVEDVDEDGHDPLEEDGVRCHVGEHIEIVAQLGRSLDLDAGIWDVVNVSAWLAVTLAMAMATSASVSASASRTNSPVSWAARRLTTSSSSWPDDDDDIVAAVDQINLAEMPCDNGPLGGRDVLWPSLGPGQLATGFVGPLHPKKQ